jgi:hypothetical protein
VIGIGRNGRSAWPESAKEAGFPSSWELEIPDRDHSYITLHPPGFHQDRDWWTCLTAERISLGSLMARSLEDRPLIGVWWYSLRRKAPESALKRAQSEIDVLVTKKLKGKRPVLPPRPDYPVSWPLDVDASKMPALLDDLPRIIAREWKLLLPFVPMVERASRRVGASR